MKLELVIRKVDSTLDSIIREDLKILSDIKSYVIESGGKRIRPILHLIFTDMLGYSGKDRWIVASITELIHAASLLHDDVVDSADTRRGRKTVGSKFGNKTAILAGDFLLACGIERLNRLQSPTLMDIFTEVIRDLSVSELLQMEWEKNPKITQEIYERVIYGKTSSLFAASTESAAILAGYSRKKAREIREFGILLGNVFQMRDDVLDYFRLNEGSGKDFLKDFKNKLYTYPILILREHADSRDKKRIPGIIESSDEKAILDMMDKYKVLDRIQQLLEEDLYELQEFVSSFPESKSTSILIEQLQKLYIQ